MATEPIDRREKLLAYMTLETSDACVLLSQDPVEATPHQRANEWRAEILTKGDVPVDCLGVSPPSAIFADEPDLPPSATSPPRRILDQMDDSVPNITHER